ncbi:MAG: hypothetical protein F4018_07065, partial [Acidobacteria bacterium]|nr:hypothetical protein [Acidobacteriota bacterium]
MRAFMISGAAVGLLLALVTPAAAQDASLVARAVDSDGGAVVGAPVVLIHVGSGERRTGITGNDGTLQ